ncbi:hypothetical protein BDW62DRAFT_205941 [Aspergillus aurantiobrunneus]
MKNILNTPDTSRVYCSAVFSGSLGGLDPTPESFPDVSGLRSHSPRRSGQGDQFKSRLEPTLLRYFIQELSSWLDVCDPDRHFARTVPQRARSCPSLLHAILTASARHITSLPKYRNIGGGFSWNGTVIQDLNEDTALHYQNHCINEFLSLSGDLEQIHNEDLLAAAIVLRFYEEIDSPLGNNDDQGVLLRILNIFVNAQLPFAGEFPRSLLEIYHSEASFETNLAHSHFDSKHHNYTPAAGLRRACFWVAFRQELYKSFMNQRPFTLPLSRWSSLRSLSPAGDGTWADRLVLCADVLEYCFGSNETNLLPCTDKDRWKKLTRYAEVSSYHLPPGFESIYSQDADPEAENPFPEIWFADDCHATATAHLELAKTLLVVFDPSRPKLGHGHVAAMNELARTVRGTVMRVCGIALHNPRSPSVFVDATMAVSACGEYVTDDRERKAILEVLRVTEVDYAWPTRAILSNLETAWAD